jgi:hypothetical protein
VRELLHQLPLLPQSLGFRQRASEESLLEFDLGLQFVSLVLLGEVEAVTQLGAIACQVLCDVAVTPSACMNKSRGSPLLEDESEGDTDTRRVE